MNKINILFLFTSLLSLSLYGQEIEKGKEVEKKPRVSRPVSPIFQKGATTIKNPLDLRDPFKQSSRRSRKRKKNYGGYLTEGKYSNLPSITAFPLGQIRIIGVLLGKNRRAIARISTGEGQASKETYMIKEGMKIGENNAEVKAIVPGGIVLVEKIRNVYDQDEYIETVIPVSTDNL
jgi:Tfp pilus assembly protein PilP